MLAGVKAAEMQAGQAEMLARWRQCRHAGVNAGTLASMQARWRKGRHAGVKAGTLA